MRPVAELLLLGALLASAACGGSSRRVIRPEFDLHDPHPARRMTAIGLVREARDPSYVPVLIEMLDDADPAVRLAASTTLREVTGRATEYRAWAPPAERRAAVLEWRLWWETRPRAASTGRAAGARP